jgi:hypothetical protein
METSNYHFYMTVTINSSPYIIQDVEKGIAYSENDIKIMIDAAKTFAAKTTITNK